MITLKRFAFKPDIWAQRQRRGCPPFLLEIGLKDLVRRRKHAFI